MTSRDLTSKANRAFEFAERQLRRLITNHSGHFPLFTKAGKWKHESESWTNWCEGFLGGMLWIVARRTGDTWWRAKAEALEQECNILRAEQDQQFPPARSRPQQALIRLLR